MTDRTVELRNGSALIGTSAALTVGTVYRLGIRQTQGSGTGVLSAWLATGETAFGSPFATSTTQTVASTTDSVRLGSPGTGAVLRVTVDDLALDTATATATATATPPAGTLERVLTYAYDGVDRLTGVTLNGVSQGSFSYDLTGNRTDGGRTYNAANQIIGASYDAAGNLLTDGATSYAYDALNRLTSTTTGGQTRTNGYNGDGVLVAQTIGGTTTRYTQDLAAPLSQVLNDGTASYVYGAERLAGVTGGVRTWYHGDLLGSVRQTTNDAGVVQGLAHYDAWGVLASGSVALAPFGFTGELQQGSDVYLRARWYNAARGSFGSRDPYAGDGTTPYSLHSYQYGYSNPVSNTDPSGYCATPPPYMGRNVICLALFISSSEVRVKFTNIILHGDNRSFSSSSPLNASRGGIWINVDTGRAVSYMNPTGYIFTFPVPICIAPISSNGEFRDPELAVAETRSPLWYFNPSSMNEWKVDRSSAGRISVSYDLVLAGPLEEGAPHINGSIVFSKNPDGTYAAFGARDGFPSAEAYYHHDGKVDTLFQRSDIRGDPEDLNAIEGEYRYWLISPLGGRALYEYRRLRLADPNPKVDRFGPTRTTRQ